MKRTRCFVELVLLSALAISVGYGRPGGTRTLKSGDSPSAPSVEEFVRRLEGSYRDVRTLRAEFSQSYTWGQRRRRESGTVYFARGGQMRWEYREPQEKLFLSEGKKMLLYIPEQKQLTRSSVKSSDDVRIPFRLLLSRLNLRKVFAKIEFANQETKREPANRVLRAIPKADAGYREVLIEVNPAFDIRRLVVFYPDGSSMEFTFDRIGRNVPLGPSLFRFTPPLGTEVIEQP